MGGRGLGGFLSKEPTEEYNKQNKYTLLISSLGGAGLQLGFVAVGNLENRLFFLRYSFLSGAAVFCPGGWGWGLGLGNNLSEGWFAAWLLLWEFRELAVFVILFFCPFWPCCMSVFSVVWRMGVM